METKTLSEIGLTCNYCAHWDIDTSELKQELIQIIKKLKFEIEGLNHLPPEAYKARDRINYELNSRVGKINFIMEFFQITEEDLR